MKEKKNRKKSIDDGIKKEKFQMSRRVYEMHVKILNTHVIFTFIAKLFHFMLLNITLSKAAKQRKNHII